MTARQSEFFWSVALADRMISEGCSRYDFNGAAAEAMAQGIPAAAVQDDGRPIITTADMATLQTRALKYFEAHSIDLQTGRGWCEAGDAEKRGGTLAGRFLKAV